MVDDELNQRRKVKFLQILLLMESFEEEDVLRSSGNQSAPLGLLKRFLFVLSLLSSTILGTCPTKLVSRCRKRLNYAYRYQDVLLVRIGPYAFTTATETPTPTPSKKCVSILLYFGISHMLRTI